VKIKRNTTLQDYIFLQAIKQSEPYKQDIEPDILETITRRN
jgi:hypothetical protein